MQLSVVTSEELEYPNGWQIMAWIIRRHQRYRVVGPSMEPTLSDGEFVLVSRRTRIAADAIVVANHPAQDTIIMKRVERFDDQQAWLRSDNSVGTDSRHFGSVPRSAIIGSVVARFPSS
jgi:nickel-type superoxide dismutase maturation protease